MLSPSPNFIVFDNRKGSQYPVDIAPLDLSKATIPISGDLDSIIKARLWLPAKDSKLRVIGGITVIIKRSILSMLDPFTELLRCTVR